MNTPLHVIILAAGAGTRMRSSQPKVLQLLAGKPLLWHVLQTSRLLQPKQCFVVYGYGGPTVKESFASEDHLQWIEQVAQLGTGHAVAQVLPSLEHEDTHSRVLVLYGDVPLIQPHTLQHLLASQPRGGIALLTAILPDPKGYGRILRNEHREIVGVVEEKDASVAERTISEINTGFLVADLADLRRWLVALTNHNTQSEYYLPDILSMAVKEKKHITAVQVDHLDEITGVNTLAQLAWVERAYQRRQANILMAAGVRIIDPARFDVRGVLDAEADVVIDVNNVFEGTVHIGADSVVGPNCVLKNARIGRNVQIYANTVIEDAVIADNCIIGPFARIRPGTELADSVHIGNFVEVKKSRLGPGSKANHLSYLGDAIIGQKVNIGAGTITCNYDGANKHVTVIEDDVFIGSDTQLVAPVTVGTGATIGAGTTVTQHVPAKNLCISRVPQQHIAAWKRPVKKG